VSLVIPANIGGVTHLFKDDKQERQVESLKDLAEGRVSYVWKFLRLKLLALKTHFGDEGCLIKSKYDSRRVEQE